MSRSSGNESTANTKAMWVRDIFVPLLILELALAAWFGFQAIQLNGERNAMHGLITSQDKQVEESKKVRDALDAIARGTAQLSDAGNSNARLVIEELKKRGIVMNPNLTSPSNGEAAPDGGPVGKSR